MNMNQLAKKIASLEGKKSQVNIAQIKEVLRVLSIIFVDEPLAIAAMIKNGASSSLD